MVVQKKWKRKENLGTIDINEIRKRERVCKNYQIYIDTDFENQVTQYNILLKIGNKDKQAQREFFLKYISTRFKKQKSVIQDIANKIVKRRNMTIQVLHLRKSIQIAHPVRISLILAPQRGRKRGIPTQIFHQDCKG